jgi:hypothetical protein
VKTISALFAVLGLALAGCDSISNVAGGVRHKLAALDEPHTRVFQADRRATYDAAKLAVDQMGFRFEHGGPAQGQLEAISGLSAGSSLENTRQIELTARFESNLEGGTEVSLRLKEIIEADANHGEGQGVGSPMRDTPLYEAFFRDIQQVLDSGKVPGLKAESAPDAKP